MNYYSDLQGCVATYIIVSKDIEDLEDLHLGSLQKKVLWEIFYSLKCVSFDRYFQNKHGQKKKNTLFYLCWLQTKSTNTPESLANLSHHNMIISLFLLEWLGKFTLWVYFHCQPYSNIFLLSLSHFLFTLIILFAKPQSNFILIHICTLRRTF